ncbi:MAG: 3-(methylthio)propionyl-CoA ligase [Gammaproteobacteria bacterium]|jgi:fatty-acyl-CoA synthase|nr:3-(methylthio)propionyl-CoA ligase [Gammaproteobacteria bacterium]MDH3758004.1 3-(methylthio)propionyl-CoA ligase [Gammaproteobacteria bacterium]MDH3862608.1 3-(methylthio)propionyl-CoA ligase [Gammaproteobacteria bacterium]MDH3904190.1 3-(methylthio)propionyl-CoA ligase [Gammaproteobacteria bacterium]MDH3907929.1 3-(methylthio)propionyl-CoA ligase [Gammaproteobacteria bacterium]
MKGLMMDTQLLISSIAQHAEKFHGDREIVSVTADNPRHRYTFREAIGRAKKLANALERLGVKQGDRVASLAWNDYRHLEIYYGVSGSGYVCHTINPRLFPEQIVFIINHAEDRFICVDVMFVPLLEAVADKIPNVEGFIILTDEAHMPETSLPNVMCYETLLAAESSEFDWPELDERSASALCYTSGTTGNPKGVLYDHRSTILHAYATLSIDVAGVSSRDVAMPVVPFFHVNAWGVPYSALMAGTKLVLPGPKMGDGEALYELIESEDVTKAFGVPTVWLSLLQYTEKTGKRLEKLEQSLVGGAAVPRAMIEVFRDKHGVELRQGWGMTETSPIGTVNTIKAGLEDLSKDEQLDLATKAGRGIFGCELRIVDDNGGELPWDGEAFGALQVRGPWVCSDYFKLEGSGGTHTDDGWFETGDVATIDPQGYVAITDRTKDVIKSGGEWISSIELENTAMGHPAVAEAAVIGVAHPKWTERPLLVVVRSEGEDVSKEEMLAYFDGKVATWWVPSDVVFVDELPHTATGKVKKIELRKQFAEYRLPG